MIAPAALANYRRGFTLPEVLIALVVGLVVVASAITALHRAGTAYASAEAAGRLQENARYALALLESDVRQANFWGMHDQPGLITVNGASVFPIGCGATWITDVAAYVTGQNNAYGLPCAASSGGAHPGADVLIVRRASSTRMTPQSATIPTADRSRILIVSNRLAGEIFVAKDIGNGIPAGYATSDPASAPPLADTRELLVHAWYIGRNSTVATGYPSLRRKRLTTGPSVVDEEILPGVEDLQFQLGIDTNGDDSVDLFANPGIAPTVGKALSVRLWLRLRSAERENGFIDASPYAYADQSWPAPGDNYRRLTVQTTIRLRNARP